MADVAVSYRLEPVGCVERNSMSVTEQKGRDEFQVHQIGGGVCCRRTVAALANPVNHV